MKLRPLAFVVALALCSATATRANETRVEAKRPVDVDDARVDDALDDAWLTGSPEDAIGRALGATVVHEGGPLSPVRPMVRGLSGARLSMSAGGLALADPATGILDAALLPWAAADAVVVESGADGSLAPDGTGAALGGALRLELLRTPGVRARFLAGSLSTARASIAASGDDGLLVAADAATTSGDFTFVPTSAVVPDVGGARDLAQVRRNNDHKRGSLLARATSSFGETRELDVDTLVAVAAHEGGIPGFAAAPTRALRGEDLVGGGRVAVTRRFTGGRLGSGVQARAARRVTEGPSDPRSTIESATARAHASMTLRDDNLGAMDVVTGASHATLLNVPQPFTRTAADAAVGAATSLGVVRLRGSANGAFTTDVGPLWGAALRVDVGEAWRAFAGVARASRAPTLDELYAPRGLVNGNPALRAEALADVEVGAALVPGRVVDARIVAHAGRIDDAIAYVNKNAFEIEPANVGAGWRAGIDISTSVEATDWAALDVVTSVLATRMDVTDSPLPLAAPFSANVAIRLGPATGPTATIATRSRAAAPSNTFGTLEAAPYTLVDVLLRAPVDQHLALGFAVHNALDKQDARDANGLPLPGRLLFVSLEVSP